MFDKLCVYIFANFTSPKGCIALQVARKVAPYDSAKFFKYEKFDLLCSSLLVERIYPTGYCPIKRGSVVPIVFMSLSEKTRKTYHLVMSM